MSGKNERMSKILAGASDTTKNTYKDADEKAEAKPQANKKEVALGRKKLSADKKKKARTIFYNDEAFAEIEACAEHLGVDSKTFMQMSINQNVKLVQKDIEDDKKARGE